MEYRVEDLAAAAGIRVDTVRFYQAQGLLDRPRRVGRIAIYETLHLERLHRIRALSSEGFSLAQIRRLLEPEAPRAEDEPLLAALEAESRGEQTYSRAALAAEASVPEPLIVAVVAAGLMQPVEIDGEERYGESDLRMARSALSILEAGMPIDALLALAVRHAGNIREVCDAAIDLFDEHVRKSGPAASDPEAIAHIYRDILPQVTRLVALHFQRTLVNRALERVRRGGEDAALEHAIAATESGRLDVTWR
ncbi:MAG: MerR family transcriptional regulator [Myxococcales bacterium]|nr:MerR family transcriptional regulator [Myxococcales bacterium]